MTRMLSTTKPAMARNDRVGERADDLGLQVFLVLDEAGDALEHVFEEAAFLPGADHADGQFVEHLRVTGHRLGQPGAVGDLAAHSRSTDWSVGWVLCRSSNSRRRSSGTPECSRSASWE